MIILELFKKNRVCTHDRVSVEADLSYCPDCGELIKNQWFLTRCNCCGVKLKATIRNGEIVPEDYFCHNCGAREFIIEPLEKINFINIDYAVLVKSVVKASVEDKIQSWVDIKTCNCRQELLPQFL